MKKMKYHKIIFVFLLCLLFSCRMDDKSKKLLHSAKLLLEKPYLCLPVTRLNELSEDQFLERIQYDYTKNCLMDKDTIAVVENDGYRINLYCVAVHNGWLSREKAATEVLNFLIEYENAKTIEGIFPRSFNRLSGEQIEGRTYWTFGQPYDVVGTAFFTTSIQFVVRQFFNRDNSIENKIRILCDKICNRVNWDFAYNIDRKCFTWFKNGEDGSLFDGKDLVGEMDETFFLQLLVLSADKWSHDKDAYNKYVSEIFIDEQYGFRYFSTKEYNFKDSKQFTGIEVKNSKNLKLKDYPTAKLGYLVQPHIWFDLEGFRDSTCIANNMDYFEGTQNAIKAQIKYAQLNPGQNKLYGDVWGFYDTYSPVTKKWMVTGLPAEGDYDEGTIAINAVISAIPFAPSETIKCLRVLYDEFKNEGIYTDKGFVMSVNTNIRKTADKPDSFFQPINVLSIENYRSGLLWELAKKAPEYKKSLNKAGLQFMGKK